MTFQLIITNPSEPNWQFSDEYDNINDIIKRISGVIDTHRKEIKQTNIYALKPFEIKIYNIEQQKELKVQTK